MKRILALILFGMWGSAPGLADQAKAQYPAAWWQSFPRSQAASWEILPQDAGPGEVILSKRTELGIFSNFAAVSFELDGEVYQSVEGFWQMLKYPEGPDDERARFAGIEWKYSRDQLSKMTAFEAKAAGDLASANMKKMGINWVSYRGQRLDYRVQTKGAHYQLIRRAMLAKLQQNNTVESLLRQTGDLKLMPDHNQGDDPPPAWRYYEIWMEFRKEMLKL
jgi:predicted NAD-dependent protein-ADP-ribosyltransferase YbiA (DUF1768 family)